MDKRVRAIAELREEIEIAFPQMDGHVKEAPEEP
jgi:hypothetical protein